jgi:hypothetical protein
VPRFKWYNTSQKKSVEIRVMTRCKHFRRQHSMSLKYPKKVIVGFGVVAALLGATILFSGYANIKATEQPVISCQGAGSCCPMMAQTASCPKVTAAQMASTHGSGTPCTTRCPKPCCAGGAAESCDNPCPIPCPKPCCAEDTPKGCCGTAGSTGCPMAAAESNVQ